MAIVEVKVPQLSESVAEATLLQWKKKVGDTVAADEILIEVETDKVVLEVPAPSAGVLAELLAVDGAMVNVGAPSEPLDINVFSLIGGRRSFAGSLIGGIRETQEMLDFCAEHGLGSEIEIIAAEQINEAYERVLASDVRYRFVIDTSTLG